MCASDRRVRPTCQRPSVMIWVALSGLAVHRIPPRVLWPHRTTGVERHRETTEFWRPSSSPTLDLAILAGARRLPPLNPFITGREGGGDPMGCGGSKPSKGEENTKKLRKPKAWKHTQPITRTQLLQMRDEFWDTAPHYGGRKEIWDALRAAADADLTLAQAIIDSAGVIVTSADMTTCYDERGAKYELPKYVLSEPTNMIQDS